MPAYAGNLVVLEIGDGGVPVESFTPLGGVQVTGMRLTQNTLESGSPADGDGWRRLAAGGMRSLRLHAQGVFSDSAAEAQAQSAALTGAVRNMRLGFGNGETLSGAFVVSEYEREGDSSEAERFRMVLESAGAITIES